MQGTSKTLASPAYISNAAANIYTPAASTIETAIERIHVANKDSQPRSFSLYVGATGGSAGGTELYKDVIIPVGGYFDESWEGLILQSTDFLSGIASAASALVITVTGKLRVK